jgi:enoyl-CoA hydratase/carnithine racemase
MGMLIQSRLTPPTAHEAMVTARRFGGIEAYAKQIVDEAVPEPEVREKAIALARQHAGKAGPALQTIKSRMYASVLAALDSEGENAPATPSFGR